MITIDSSEFRRFKVAADAQDKVIVRSLRKNIKALGGELVLGVQKEVKSGGSGGESAGSREGIAAGTKLTVSFAQKSGGVKITTTNSRLDAEHKGFVAAYNEGTFRHPVFGNRSAFVPQTGHPYFGASIEPLLDKELEGRMKAVIDDAVHALGGHGQ